MRSCGDIMYNEGTITSFKELLNEIAWSWEYPSYDLEKTEEGHFSLNKLYIAPDHASYKTQMWNLGPGVFAEVEAFYNLLNK